MNTHPLWNDALKTLRTLAIAGAAVACVAAAIPSQPAVVASVDIERLFNNLDASESIEARRARLQTEIAGRLDACKAQFQDLQEELDSFAPGTPAHDAAAKAALAKAGELRALEGFAEVKMEVEKANAMRDLYDTVKRVAGAVAAEHHIDIVFIDDATPPIQTANLAGTMEQINGRRMLFAAKTLDITDLLVQRVNAELRATAGGGTGTANTASAASGAAPRTTPTP